MSNTNNNYTPEDYTIALDEYGKVLFCDTPTSLIAYYFAAYVTEAKTIIHGKKLSSNPTPYLNHANVRNIFTYDVNTKNTLSNFFSDGTNNSGESVTISQISTYDDLDFKRITVNDSDYLIKDNTIPISFFGVNGDGTDETDKINEAIACAINNGCKLLFDGTKTYTISKPIMICAPDNSSVRNDFIIDFNHATITIDYESDRIFDSYYSRETKTPIFDSSTNEAPYNSMIYVSAGFNEEGKQGIIRNLRLAPGIAGTIEYNYYGKVSWASYYHSIKNGLYLEASSQIHFENIKILDVERGIYIAEKYGEVFNENITMDNIQISKTRDGDLSLLDISGEYDKRDAYSSSSRVGIDCRANNCKFSNIIVIDYLVGMRVLGENNDVYGAHIWNTYCPEQYKDSVCFINAKANTYTACVADHFHIGWLATDIEEFKLINCHWLGTEIKPKINGVETKIDTNGYGFYIADSIADNYAGANIKVTDCYMVGSDLSRDDCYLEFCNIKNNDIVYSGAIENTFYAPIDGMQKFVASENNIHDIENNSTFNQYGRIKLKNTITVSNIEESDFYEVTKSNSSYIDNGIYNNNPIFYPVNGTLELIDDNTSQDSTEIYPQLCLKPTDGTDWNQIHINLRNLGYDEGDVGFITFDYNIEDNLHEKVVNFNHPMDILNYFDNSLIGQQDLESTQKDEWKTFSYWFKLEENSSSFNSANIAIGYGENVTGAPQTKSDVYIKNLRIMKNPFNYLKIPKYHLETEENYCSRISEFFHKSNGNLTYNSDKKELTLLLPQYIPSDTSSISFISLPFRYKIKSINGDYSDNRYSLYYSKLGIPCFSETNIEENSYKSAVEMQFDSGSHKKLFLRENHVYNLSPAENEKFNASINNWENVNDNFQYRHTSNLQSFNLPGGNTQFANTIKLPTCDNQTFILTNLICNPHGYYFESPVDAEFTTDYTAIFSKEGNSNLKIASGTYTFILKEQADGTLKLSYVNGEVLNDAEYTFVNSYGATMTNDNAYDLAIEKSNVITFSTDKDICIKKLKNKTIYKLIEFIDIGTPIFTDIPLYKNGEVRLLMKDAEYSTDLPTVLFDIEYANNNDLVTDL